VADDGPYRDAAPAETEQRPDDQSKRWEVTRADLATLLGVTGPTISNAVAAGAPVKARGDRGTPTVYDLTEFLPWWIAKKEREARELKASQGPDQGEALDNELKREKLAILRRENVPRSVLSEVLRDAFTRIRVALDRIPSRHAGKCVNLPNELAAMPILAAIAQEVKAELREPANWAPRGQSEALEP
jgi:phage terminase Nu1 subunit (DNA packaging protein)